MKEKDVRNDRSKNEAEIHELIESWVRSIRTENLDPILANHSSAILMFDLPGPVQLKGIDPYKKSWLALFDWIRSGGGFDLSEVTVTAGDDVAFATALINCRGTDANGRNGDRRPLDHWTAQNRWPMDSNA
jgi:ketosteroid isomerase-like protein